MSIVLGWVTVCFLNWPQRPKIKLASGLRLSQGILDVMKGGSTDSFGKFT